MEKFKNGTFRFFLIIASLSFVGVFAKHDYFDDLVQLKGFIRLSKEFKKTPRFTMFFAGVQSMSNEDGIFSLMASRQQAQNISILICKKFAQKFQKSSKKKDSNTVFGQFINLKKPYRYFVQGFDMLGQKFWIERRLDSNKIPESCLIIIMNPKIVKKFRAWHVKPSNFYQGLVDLTVDSDKFSEEKIGKSEYKSLLGTNLDTNVFFERSGEKRVVLKSDKNMIKLAVPAI